MTRAVDLFEDGFPHGTVEGFEGGCRSAGACPAGREHGLTCRGAKILAAGNYQYQQLVRAGKTPAEIAETLRLRPEEQVAPRQDIAPVTVPLTSPALTTKRKWAVRHAWVAFDPDGNMHGPFDGHREAIDFVGGHLEPTTTAKPPIRRTRKPWTDEDTAQLRELNGLGFSDNEVARRLGRSQGLVSMYRRRLGIQSNRERQREQGP